MIKYIKPDYRRHILPIYGEIKIGIIVDVMFCWG